MMFIDKFTKPVVLEGDTERAAHLLIAVIVAKKKDLDEAEKIMLQTLLVLLGYDPKLEGTTMLSYVDGVITLLPKDVQQPAVQPEPRK